MQGGYPPQDPNQGGYGYGQPPSPYGGYGAPPPQGMAMQTAGAPYGVDPMTGIPFSDKSKMVAGLLQIFLGWAGAGRLYTGHIGLAFAQIAVVWFTCGLGGLWPLIDGIMMLTGKVTDVQGRPLRDG